jgi:hypothetical protein
VAFWDSAWASVLGIGTFDCGVEWELAWRGGALGVEEAADVPASLPGLSQVPLGTEIPCANSVSSKRPQDALPACFLQP